MANKADGKLIYVTIDGGPSVEDQYAVVHVSLQDAYSNSDQDGDDTVVSVYKLVKTVKVTRTEVYNEEVI